jgi:Putative HNHc nuclease
MKRRPIRPSLEPIRRWTPLRAKNEERAARDFVRAFGSVARVQAINAIRCIVPRCRSRRSDNAHLRSRRVATWREVFAACRRHHRESHDIGLRSFAAKYNVDPWAMAARLAEEVPV